MSITWTTLRASAFANCILCAWFERMTHSSVLNSMGTLIIYSQSCNMQSSARPASNLICKLRSRNEGRIYCVDGYTVFIFEQALIFPHHAPARTDYPGKPQIANIRD